MGSTLESMTRRFSGEARRCELLRRPVAVMPGVVIGAFALIAALLVGSTGARAQATPPGSSSQDPSPHSEARLVSERDAVVPGESFTVALRLQMDEGWHSYWKNPGDSGQRTSIEWVLPEGFRADSIQWPYPHRIELEPLMNYGYSDLVHLPVEMRAPADLEPGSEVELAGTANWLICEEICYPASAELNLELPVRENGSATEWQDEIQAAQGRVPRPVESWTVEAVRSEGSYALRLTPPEDWSGSLDEAYFFSAEKAVLDHAAPQPFSEASGRYTLALQQSEYAQEPASRLRGTVVAGDGRAVWTADENVQALRVDVPVRESGELSVAPAPSEGAAEPSSAGSSESSAALAPASPASEGMSTGWALLFALGGGILLNLMPCVFPILSVKILGFADQAGASRRRMRNHGLLFGLGILASMWVLAGILLALRAGGTSVGWGFQLQSPYFVGGMVVLFSAIGANLLGVFEVGSSFMNWAGRLQQRTSDQGYSSSFLTGVLTTVVATPCTAPFMGAALGFAITLSSIGALSVFTALGAGIALPYVILSLFPGWLERLPDPGSWMETLKQLLAFPMFAAAIWLLWVFGQQAGVDGMAYLMAGLLLLAAAGWILHRWPAPGISTRKRLLTRGIALLLLAGGLGLATTGAGGRPVAQSTNATSEASGESRWASFSPNRVENLRAEGRPVFIDFTAAWCLTCQVNKRTVLRSEAVQQAFADRNVALVRADWTNRDAEITKALEGHGRSGVPLYVLYPGDGGEPQLLPEVLTQQIVLDALDRLPAQRASEGSEPPASTDRSS